MPQQTLTDESCASDNRGQPALHHHPGRFRELLVFSRARGRAASKVVQVAACLLKHVELGLAEKPVRILVALGPSYVSGLADSRPGFAAEAATLDREEFALLIQIAAETEDGRTYARRLVKRLVKETLSLSYASSGGRHVLNRGCFGYPEPPAGKHPTVPLSQAADAGDGTWLLFQNCVQDVDKFYELSSEQQDAVMGRLKTAGDEEVVPAVESHVSSARDSKPQGSSPLLRRSFSYENFDEAGLNFISVGSHPDQLRAALTRFEKADPLVKQGFVQLAQRGFFFVPPNADWLMKHVELPVVKGLKPEDPFFPKHSILLYELTPAANRFFRQVFHRNNQNLDVDSSDTGNRVLRPDVKLISRALTKLAYGATITQDGQLYRLLEMVFESDSSHEVVPESMRAPWAHKCLAARVARAARVQKRAAVRNARLNQSDAAGESAQAIERNSKLATAQQAEVAAEHNYVKAKDSIRALLDDEWLTAKLQSRDLSLEWAPLLKEMVLQDAETPYGVTADGQFSVTEFDKARHEIDKIAETCEDAAEQARALNQDLGKYMTFSC